MKSKELTPEIKSVIIETYEELQSIRETKDKVNGLLDITLTYHNVRDTVSSLKEDIDDIEEVLEELNDEITEKPSYEVREEEDGHHYILEHKQLEKVYKLSVEFVDKIFKDYSKHGNNLSGEEILQKYKLKPQVWNLIKSKLRLYKASDVISPFTAATLSEEDLQVKIDEAIDENISKTKEKMVVTHEKKFHKEAKKAMKIVGTFEEQLKLLKEVIDTYEPREQDFIPEEPKNNEEVTILFSDVHIGKKDTHLIKERIYKMTNDILKRNESRVNIIGLGDYVETIVEGGMHPGQIENMEGPFGFDLIMDVVKLLENMLIELYKNGKQVSLYGIAGNHDRLTQNNAGDLEKTGGIIIYELIKRGLQNIKVNIEYFREEWNSLDLDDFNFIINHGTKNNTRINANQILWHHGKQDKHNIIAFGDKHHLEAMDVAGNGTKVIVPALAGAGEYDQRLVLSSYPGYVIVEKNDDGLPNTLVRRLK